MKTIEWFGNEEVEKAIARARDADRPLLVDFFSPTCRGCAKLLARTYPDPAVQALGPRFVWIKYDTTAPNPWFRKLNGKVGHHWHPDLVVLDAHLVEFRRVLGYLPPEELVPQLELGRALGQLHHRQYALAATTLGALVEAWPRSAAAPEALYWAGVAAYRARGEADLRRFWSRIAAEYPVSDWRLRADCLDVVLPEEGFTADDPSTITVLR